MGLALWQSELPECKEFSLKRKENESKPTPAADTTQENKDKIIPSKEKAEPPKDKKSYNVSDFKTSVKQYLDKNGYPVFFENKTEGQQTHLQKQFKELVGNQI